MSGTHAHTHTYTQFHNIHTVFTHILTRELQERETTQYLHTECTECYIQITCTLHNSTRIPLLDKSPSGFHRHPNSIHHDTRSSRLCDNTIKLHQIHLFFYFMNNTSLHLLPLHTLQYRYFIFQRVHNSPHLSIYLYFCGVFHTILIL